MDPGNDDALLVELELDEEGDGFPEYPGRRVRYRRGAPSRPQPLL